MRDISEDRVTIYDVNRAGYCVKGIRDWCRQQGIPFRDFVKNGIPISEVEKMDDAIVQDVLRVKRGGRTNG